MISCENMQYTYIFSSIMTRCALYKAETVGVAKAQLAHMLLSLTVREVSYRFVFMSPSLKCLFIRPSFQLSWFQVFLVNFFVYCNGVKYLRDTALVVRRCYIELCRPTFTCCYLRHTWKNQ